MRPNPGRRCRCACPGPPPPMGGKTAPAWPRHAWKYPNHDHSPLREIGKRKKNNMDGIIYIHGNSLNDQEVNPPSPHCEKFFTTIFQTKSCICHQVFRKIKERAMHFWLLPAGKGYKNCSMFTVLPSALMCCLPLSLYTL